MFKFLAFFRLFFIKTYVKGKWRLSRRYLVQDLYDFSKVEYDSAWQYKQAMFFEKDIDNKVVLLDNVIDEIRHSKYFFSLAKNINPNIHPPINKRRIKLVGCEKELKDFYALTYLEEFSISHEFENYAKASKSKEVSEVFLKIKEEELQHANSNVELLKTNTKKDSSQFEKIIWKQKKQKVINTLISILKPIGKIPVVICCLIIYLLAGITTAIKCKKLMKS
jgi:hypothetical protein